MYVVCMMPSYGQLLVTHLALLAIGEGGAIKFRVGRSLGGDRLLLQNVGVDCQTS